MKWGPLLQFCKEVTALNVAIEGAETTEDGLPSGKPLYVRVRAGEKTAVVETVESQIPATGESPDRLFERLQAIIMERRAAYRVFLVEAVPRGETRVVKTCPPIYSDVDPERETGLATSKAAQPHSASELALAKLSESIDRRSWEAISEVRAQNRELAQLMVENRHLSVVNDFLMGTIRDLEGSQGDAARAAALQAFTSTFAPLIQGAAPLIIAKLAQAWGMPMPGAGKKKKAADGQAPPPPPPPEAGNVASDPAPLEPAAELAAIVERVKAILAAHPDLAPSDLVVDGFAGVVDAHPELKAKLVQRFMASMVGG